MDYIEFSAKIKEKYPEYKDVDDFVLAQKIVEKYPEYKEKVTFEGVKEGAKEKPAQKGLDLTPSGLVDKAVNTITAGIETPVRMIKDKQNISDAFKSGYENSENIREQVKNLNPVLSKVADFSTDMAGYSALPVLRGDGVVNFIGNAAIQGGVPGILESLKRDGSPVDGAVGGTAFAAALQAIPKVGNLLAKGGDKVLELSSRLGQIKPETLKQAIKPESTALEMTSDDASNLLYDLTKQIRSNFDVLKNKRGDAVNQAVENLGNKAERFEIKDLLNDIKGSFDQYQKDLVNPARELAGGLEKDITGLINKGTENPAKYYEFVPENTSPYYSKEKEEEAFKILQAATGKPINWLKSQLKAYTSDGGVGARKEFIENLVRNTDDKLANLGEEYFNGFNHYRPVNLDEIGSGSEIAQKAFDDIANRQFNVVTDDALTRALNQADNGYKELVSNIAKDARNEEVYNAAFPKLQNIIKDLPKSIQDEYGIKLMNVMDDIYKKANTVSPLSLQGIKETIGKLSKWGDETQRGYADPITRQIYGKFTDRLSELSPEIKAANKAYSDLMAFKNNDTVGNILKGDLLSGGKLGNAPSALKSYKSSINKESGARNLKDLENLLVKETSQKPFLNKIDDINAAMDLLKTENTGIGGLAGLAKAVLTRPALTAARAVNRSEIPQKIKTVKDALEPIAKLLPYMGAKGISSLMYGNGQ